MQRKTAFITNAREYAAPPAITALAKAGWDVFCADVSFESAAAREAFEQENPFCHAATAQTAAAFIAEGLARFGKIDALISNDIPRWLKAATGTMAATSFNAVSGRLDDFEAYLDSLASEPVRLLRAAIPAMLQAGAGSIVLVTSGAPLVTPMTHGPHGYIAGRAAANLLAKSLAAELAPHKIQVNAVAPYLLYSPTFFPSELGADDPNFAPLVSRMVPMQRFGEPAEIGALIASLVSGEMSFVSGQVIAFSGAGC